jgi:ribosomal protein S18 acetylase RimI-like enzyme
MLTVRANNPAYGLYQRLGFETMREIVNRVGTVSYEMHLTL